MNMERLQHLNSEMTPIPLEMYAISGHGEVNPDKYLRDKEQDDLIRKAISASDSKDIFRRIKKASKEERVEIIKAILEKGNSLEQMQAALTIWECSEKDQEKLQAIVVQRIREDLAKSSINFHTMEMIGCVSEEDNHELILLLSNKVREILEKEDFVMLNVGMLDLISEEEQPELKLLVYKKIKDCLSGSNIEEQANAARLVEAAPKDKQAKLRSLISKKIREALAKKDPLCLEKAAEMIEFSSEDDQETFIEEYFDMGLGKLIIKPPLYTAYPDMNTVNFNRREFIKSGSDSTLLGGPLKDKLIIRHIEPKAFISWQKIYENHKIWKDNGFDYVPIEPIQSYRLNKDGLVDVYAGVLDLNLNDWINKAGEMFDIELFEQRDEILHVLDKMKIKHGHAHNGNFVLRFFRDEHGNPIISKTPRLYLIDFDQAVSP